MRTTLVFTLVSFSAVIHMTVARTHQYKTKIAEGGEVFEQLTRINKESGMEYFHVPKHGSVDESRVLVDYNRKLVLTRIERLKKCYLRKILRDDVSPAALDYSMKKMHTKTPWHRFMTIQKNELIVRKITKVKSLSSAFQKLCKGLDIFYTILAPYDENAIKKLALKVIKSNFKKNKRQITLRGFYGCNSKSSREVMRCLKHGYAEYLNANQCTLRTSSCVYYANCSYRPYMGVVQCNAPSHLYTGTFCCYYSCGR